MKKTILAIVMAMLTNCVLAQPKGLKFEPISDTEAKLVDGHKAEGKVIIPETVNIKGKEYIVTVIGKAAFGIANISNYKKMSKLEEIYVPGTVKKIEDHAFQHCYEIKKIDLSEGLLEIGEYAFAYLGVLDFQVESIVIPNSVIRIGSSAFEGNHELKSVVVPDEAPKGANGKEKTEYIFLNCKDIVSVRGHNLPFTPRWVDESQLDEKSPVYKSLNKTRESFLYNLYYQGKDILEAWKQKDEFETTDHWNRRMNEDSINAQWKIITKQIKNDYITKNSPKDLKFQLGEYDADKEAFLIESKDYGSIFIKVPFDVAENFEKNFQSVNIKPAYGVVNNKLVVIAAECHDNNGKVYHSIKDIHSPTQDNIAYNLAPIELNLNSGKDGLSVTGKDDVDHNIPQVNSSNDRTFAVVIGNEQYQRVTSVPFAESDAKTFAAYCNRTLGLPKKNIRLYLNTTLGSLMAAIKDIKDIATAFKGDVSIIFYYAGHGIPNEASGEAYLLPVDADGRKTEVCYPTKRLYDELGQLQARNVTVFLDACFSGSLRGEGMIASARGVAIKAKTDAPQGNMIVFSAASGDETAYPYKEKGHGMFTYYLLKKLQETKGDCTMQELTEFVKEQVSQQSVVINRKKQTPTTSLSPSIANTWGATKLK